MRFIGNKELIISDIKELLKELKLINKKLVFFDAFCGTGAVSDSLKDSFNLVSNDMLNWCVIYTKGRIFASQCKFEKLGFDPFNFFLENKKIVKGFFYNNYSPGGSDRMYFTAENGGRIDFMRITIEKWKIKSLINENEYAFLLSSLIESVSVVSNTAGVYGAFFETLGFESSKIYCIKKSHIKFFSPINAKFVTTKLEDIISNVKCDILYLDPPYTQNQYGTQYHLLETLVLYDKPSISEITGSRSTTPMRSDWSKDLKSHILFDEILAKTKAKYIVFSYSKDGFMSKSFIEASMKRYGKTESFICKKLTYRKYTNFKSKEKNNHFEYLFFIEKKNKNEIVYESPLNYIGSKAKMASLIKNNTTRKFDTFVDSFGGGFNVGINIDAKNIIYNDVNHFVSGLVESFRITDTYKYILFLKRVIKKFNLEPQNSTTYIKIRDFYNSFNLEKRDPKLLYAVILYSFNQQIRFNGNHEYNNPVGMRWFNDKVLEKMISFSRIIKEKNIIFESKDYHQLNYKSYDSPFTYLDPPYMLTNGSYNDGKRGFQGWTSETENIFFEYIDKLDKEGHPFMVSYVLEHKGRYNVQLEKWIKKKGYNLINVDPLLGNNRKEILITNFKTNVKATLYN